jgi:hypothetical protein
VPLESTEDVAFVSESREFTSGNLVWQDGESGNKTFILNIKSFSSWEIEKVFVIKLESIIGFPSTVGNGEVGPMQGSVVLTVSYPTLCYFLQLENLEKRMIFLFSSTYKIIKNCNLTNIFTTFIFK